MQRIHPYALSLTAALAIVIVSVIPVPEIKMIENVNLIDKWAHFVMYGGLACVVYFDYYRLHRERVFGWCLAVMAVVGPTLLGAALEWVQANLTTCRSGEWLDAVANATGAVLAIPLGIGVVRPLVRRLHL